MSLCYFSFDFFFFNDTATTEIYTLSLHDALPIWHCSSVATRRSSASSSVSGTRSRPSAEARDRKSTRLNSSHRCISYAVFCLKKKKKNKKKHVSENTSYNTMTHHNVHIAYRLQEQ